MGRALFLVTALAAALSFAGSASAQDARADARQRFSRGVELVDEGRYEAALAEFQRAYELAPAPAVLYNIAQVHAALGHALESVAAYERYLRDAGEAVSADRRADVEAALVRQRSRIARLSIEASVLGATITIDDVDVGTTPLAGAIEVDAGEHVVAARAPGSETTRRRVRVAGGVHEQLRLELIPTDSSRATLRIVSMQPGLEVLIDDRPMGITPFDATLPVAAGPHRIRARRDGYRSAERAIVVEPGTELEVPLALELDPAAPAGVLGELALTLPDAPWSLIVDGAPHAGDDTRFELPIGPHDVVVQVADREPWRARIEIGVAAVTELAPELEWTREALSGQGSAATYQYAAGVPLLVIGAIATGVGIGVLVWNQDEWQRLVSEYTPVHDICRASPADCPDVVPPGPEGPQSLTAYNEWVNYQRQVRLGFDVGFAVTTGVGVAMMVSGIALIATAPTGARGGSAARLDVRIGAGTLSIDGSF